MHSIKSPIPYDDSAVAGAMQRAIGLMHLLAAAYANQDDRHGPPSQEVGDGIRWLVMKAEDDLHGSLDPVLQWVESQVSVDREMARKGADS